MIRDTHHLYGLKIRWTAVALASAVLMAALWITIEKLIGFKIALQWLPAALAVSAMVLGALRWQLELNRDGDGALFKSLGPANLLTVLRGLLVAGVAGFVAIQPERLSGTAEIMWLPASLFLAALLLDVADGWVARRYNRITELGRRLDTQLDGLTVLCGSLLAVMWAKAPAWIIIAGLAYYLFTAGCWLRGRLSGPCGVLPPSKIRQLLAVLMMATIGIILFPPVPPALGRLAAAAVAVPFLANFLWDWFTVCRIRPSFPKNR